MTEKREIFHFVVYSSTNGTRNTIAISTLSTMDVYLPPGGQSSNYAVRLVAEIRDTYGAVSYWNISTVTVRSFLIWLLPL